MRLRHGLEWVAVATLLLAIASLAPAQGAKNKPAPKPAPKPATQPQEKPLEFGDTGPEFEMPAPWPAPAAKPDGSIEVAALALAKDVLDGGPKALPALERAALESGFAIRDENGAILYAPDPKADLGLAVSDFELAAASYLTTKRDRDDLDAFNKVFAARSDLAGMDLKALSMQAVSDFWASMHPGKRFWGAFVMCLGSASYGEFSSAMVDLPPNTICSVQLVWLAYGAAGQMAAGSQPAPFGSELDLPMRGPHAFDPFASRQGRVAAIHNLALMVQHLGAEAIAKHIRQNASQGNPPEIAMLEMVQNDLIKTGTRVTGTLSNSPLVRTKVLGQKGGQTNLDIRVDFRLSAAVRAKFAKLAQQLGATAPLPPNGPLVNRVVQASVQSDLVELPDPIAQTTAGRFRLVVRGRTQTKGYSADALPVAKDASILVNVQQVGVPEFGAGRSFTVPIRDWKEPGVFMEFRITAKGFGTSMGAIGSSTFWSTNRSVSGTADLTQPMPIAMMPNRQGQMSTELGRHISWRANPLEPSIVVYQRLFEEILNRTVLPGCDGLGVESSSTVISSRNREPQPRIIGSKTLEEVSRVLFQLDHKKNLMSFELDPNRHVEVTQKNSKGHKLDFRKKFFADLEFDKDALARDHLSLPEGTVWEIQAAPMQNSGYPAGWSVYVVTITAKASHSYLDKEGEQSVDVNGIIRIIRTPNSSPTMSEASARLAVESLMRQLGANGMSDRAPEFDFKP